jgi:outer membrane immunogenic protein
MGALMQTGLFANSQRAVLAAAIAAFGFVNSADAADMPAKTPVYKSVAPVFNWSGWYVGGNAGYGFGSSNISNTGLDFAGINIITNGLVPASLGDRPKGFVGGLQLGWNQQAGNIVYGAEADFSYAHIGDSASQTLSVSVPPPGLTIVTSGEQKLDWFGTLRGRLGVVAQDRSLIYATGGLAYGRGTISASAINTTNPLGCGSIVVFCMAGSAAQWKAGWTIGGGWEYAFAQNWSAKLEYLYYDLGNISEANLPLSGGTVATMQSSARLNGSIARVGLNYLFH